MISDLELLGAVCLFFFTSTFHTLELASVTIARLVSWLVLQEMITFMHCSIFKRLLSNYLVLPTSSLPLPNANHMIFDRHASLSS